MLGAHLVFLPLFKVNSTIFLGSNGTTPPILPPSCTCDSELANQQPPQHLCCALWQRLVLLPLPLLNVMGQSSLELLRKQSEARGEIIRAEREHRWPVTSYECLDVA